MMVLINTKNQTIKLIASILAILPLLQYYDFPGPTILMDSVITIVLVFVLLYTNNKYTNTGIFNNIGALKYYLLMYIYIVIVTIISYIFFDTSKAYIFAFLFLEIIEVICIQNISSKSGELFNRFTNIYIFICVVLSFITIFEEILYAMTGILIPFRIIFLPLTDNISHLDHRFGFNRRGIFMGFSPFFSEPSHMVQYMLPASSLLIAKENSHHDVRNWINILLIAVAIVLSTSTFGILSFLISMLFYFITHRLKNAPKIKKTTVFLMPVLILIFWNFIRERLFYNVSDDGGIFSEGKTSARILRGFIYYVQFPLFNKIFGIGFNNFSEFISTHNFSYEYIFESKTTEYLNGLQQALIYGGIISLLLFINFIICLYRGESSELKSMIVLFVLLMSSTSTFLRGGSVFYIVIILMLKNNNDLTKYDNAKCSIINRKYLL